VEACTDPHVLASALKQYYAKLPEPLLPAACYRQTVGLGGSLHADRLSTEQGKLAASELTSLVRRHLDSCTAECAPSDSTFGFERLPWAA